MRDDEPIGSVADEAARLIESLRRAGAEATREPPEPPEAAGAPGASEAQGAQPRRDGADATGCTCGGADGQVRAGEAQSCAYCPVCRGITVLRGVSPEMLERMAELATSAAALLSDLAAGRGGGLPDDRPRPAPQPAAHQERSACDGDRIDVLDEEE